MLRRLPDPALPLLLATLVALVGLLVIGGLATLRVQTFHAGKQDLDIQGQVIWNTAHGRPYASTVLIENDVHLAEHLAFSLAPMALLYLVVPSPVALVLVQALAVVGASLAIFLYARELLGDLAQALLMQFAFLAYPVTAVVALQDFHPVALAMLPLSFAAYLLLRNRIAPGLALLALAVLAEEEAALPAMGLGLLLAWRGFRRVGVAVAVAGLLYAALASQVVMPAFQTEASRRDGPNRSLGRYSELRRDPLAFTRLVFGPGRVEDAARWLLVPTGGVALLGAPALVPALPTLGALLLTDEDLEHRWRQHWGAMLLPFLALASVEGVRRAAHLPLGSLVSLGLVACGAGYAYADVSRLPGGDNWEPQLYREEARDAALSDALSEVPSDVPLAASLSVIAYLNHRPAVYIYPPSQHYAAGREGPARTVDFAVLDLADRDTRRTLQERDLVLFSRHPPPVLAAPAPRLLFVMASAAPPTVAMSGPSLVGGRLRLLGYDLAFVDRRLRLTLHWQVEERLVKGWHRTVELRSSGDSPLAEEREMQLGEILPPETWLAGQRLLDRVEFSGRSAPLPDLAAYRIRVRWSLAPGEGQPPLDLPAEGGGSALELPPLKPGS